MPMDFQGRLKNMRAALDRQKVDVLVVTHLPNVRYLCGFSGSAGVLLAAPRPLFFTDGRYAEQASVEVVGARVSIAKGGALAAVAATCLKLGLKRVAIESEHFTVAQSDAFNRHWARESNWSASPARWNSCAPARMPTRSAYYATRSSCPRNSSGPCCDPCAQA